MTVARRRRVILGCICLSGLAASAMLGRSFYRRHPQELWFNYYLLPPVPVLRVISLGQDASLADLLYTSTTMTPDYFKDRDERARIVTTANATAFQLDPDFHETIYYGHFFVEFEKYSAGKHTEENDPRRLAASDTSYLLLTGFHASNTSGQFAEVAAQELLPFKQFANVEHLSRLAIAKQSDAMVGYSLLALTRLKEGDTEEGLRIWRKIAQQTASRENPQTKYFHVVAETRIAYLLEKPRIDALEIIIETYHQATGNKPASWADLIRTRQLKAIPLDSHGNPFILNPATGRVDLTPPSAKETFK